MKIEGCASPEFIKSCLPESMIYTSEHMTIKHCPSNKLGPFLVIHGYWQLSNVVGVPHHFSLILLLFIKISLISIDLQEK